MSDEQAEHLRVIRRWSGGNTVSLDRLIAAFQFYIGYFGQVESAAIAEDHR